MTTRTLCAAIAFAVASIATPSMTNAQEASVVPQQVSLTDQVARLQADFAAGDLSDDVMLDRIDSVIEKIDLKLDAGATNKKELLTLRGIAMDLREQISGITTENGSMLAQLAGGTGVDSSGYTGGGGGGFSSSGVAGGTGATGTAGSFGSFGSFAAVAGIGGVAASTSNNNKSGSLPGPIGSPSSN